MSDRILQRLIVLCVAFMLTMSVFLLGMQQMGEYFTGQIISDQSSSMILTELELMDQFSGLVNVRIAYSDAFEQQLYDQYQQLTDAQFPLRLELCLLKGASGSQVFCEEMIFQDPSQSFDLTSWDQLSRDLYLSLADLQTSYLTEFRVFVEGEADPVLFQSEDLPLTWAPSLDLRDAAGLSISPDETLSAGMDVFVFTRADDLELDYSDGSLDLEPLQAGDRSDPAFFAYRVQLPLDDVPESSELCFGWSGMDRCHDVDFEPRPAAPEFICGDGERNPGEQCDDGNFRSGDGCDELCRREVRTASCGDGVWDQGEACDDGNLISGDGCDDLCQIEEPVVIETGEFLYPDFKLYFNEISAQHVFLFASLEQKPADQGRIPEAEELFIRLKTDVPGGIVPQTTRREGGLPILQTILPKGTRVNLEFIHRLADGSEVVFASHYVDTFEPEVIIRGQESEPGLAQTPTVAKLIDRSLIPTDGMVDVSEDVRVQVPSDRFTNESLTIAGVSDAESIKTCLVELQSGDIRDGKTLIVRDNGTFYDRLTDEYLDPGKYAVLMYSDTQESCRGLIDAFVAQDQSNEQPLVLEVVDSALNISVLDLDWLPSDDLVYDFESGFLFDTDPSQTGRIAPLEITSSFQEDIEVVVSFVDELVDYEQTLNGYGRDQVLLDFDVLDYGPQRLRVFAVLPNGQKTADILYEFDYQPLRQAASESSQNWRWMVILFLLILGGLYLSVRVRTFRAPGADMDLPDQPR